MEDKGEGFRVIDKRHSANSEDSKDSVAQEAQSASQGEGFTMKESPEKNSEGLAELDFSTFVFSLATGAFVHLGLAPDPSTNKTEKNLGLAKQNIDILALLSEKTKGNLNAEEEKLLTGLLTEARLKYVEVAKA